MTGPRQATQPHRTRPPDRRTPVRQVHLFDGDVLLQHNPFRAPGAASIEQLRRGLTKVAYYTEMYSAMRTGIVAHPYYLDEGNVDELKDMTFVFIAIDDGPPKRHISCRTGRILPGLRWRCGWRSAGCCRRCRR